MKDQPATIASLEAIGPDRQVTCWVTHCSVPSSWIVRFEPPVMGADLITLCDNHLYDFATNTQSLP